MPPANKDKINGKKTDNRRAMIAKTRLVRQNGKHVKKHEQAQHGWQHTPLQPNPQGKMIFYERFRCHAAVLTGVECLWT